MALLIFISLTIVFIQVQGQVNSTSNYTCTKDNDQFEFTRTLDFHSAWNSSLNCSLSICNQSSSNTNDTCRTSMTPCFNYQTRTNISYCAPAIACSILQSCHNITGECAGNHSVCIVNSCCAQGAVCLPLSVTKICSDMNEIETSTTISASETLTQSMSYSPLDASTIDTTDGSSWG